LQRNVTKHSKEGNAPSIFEKERFKADIATGYPFLMERFDDGGASVEPLLYLFPRFRRAINPPAVMRPKNGKAPIGAIDTTRKDTLNAWSPLKHH
jgi:hypothetical protein